MSAIVSALQSGHSAKKILDFIKKIDPALAAKISVAMNAGHSIEKIVNFLGLNGDTLSKPLKAANESQGSLYGAATKSVNPAIGNMAKAAGTAIAAGAGLYGLMRATSPVIPQVLPALQTPKPMQLPGQLPQLGLPGPQNIQGLPAPAQNIPAAPHAPSVPQQPSGFNAPATKQNAAQRLSELGIKGNVDNLLKTGNTPDVISAFLTSKNARRGQVDPELSALIAEYDQQRRSESPSLSSGESGLPSATSPGVMPSPSSVSLQQEEPASQTSALSTSGESRSNLAITPSTLEGPKNVISNLQLGSIDPSSNRIIRQSYDNFNDIYNAVETSFPSFQKSLEDLKKSIPGISYVQSRVKDKGAAELKASQKGNPNSLSDYAGGRIIVDTDQALNEIRNVLGSQAFETDDFINSPRDDGYRALHYQIPIGNGVSAEVQIMPKEVKEVFKDAHDLYDKWKRKETFTQPEKLQMFKDYQKMKSIFDDAWNKYEQRQDKKGKTVILPSGEMGQVKAQNGKNAIIKVDGKDKQIKIDEAETIPLNDDEIADLYDNLFAKIPEDERSGFISWAGYDEKRNTLGYIPRGGKYEEIKDVPPEYAQAIKNSEGQARTSGEKREGLWIAGEKTRGGLIYNLIEKIKKDREGAQARQPEFGFIEELPEAEKKKQGMIPIFDELAYARQKSRDREKRIREQAKAKKKSEKEAEKAKLKAEKDAEKARKKAKK